MATGVLVVTLTCHGLVALPPPWLDKVRVDAQVTLFCLLLTWLVTRAAESHSKIDSQTMDYNKEDKSLPLVCDIPFEVAGIQYTLLDGNPSLLVAVQVRGEGIPAKISNTVERYLTSVTLGKALEPFTLQESISSTVDISPLSSILKLPLSSFFSFQEDTSPLSTPVSFYWYSSYHQSCLPSSESLVSRLKPTTTIFTLHESSLRNPLLILSVFWRALSSGLSIVGLRTAYGKQKDSILQVVTTKESDRASADDSMVLSVALRGPEAIQSWMEVVGPQDGKLAKITDPSSLTATFGSDLIQTLRTPFRSSAALAKWFGGRACLKTCSVFGMSDSRTKSERRKRQRVRFSETQSESEDGVVFSPVVDLAFPPLVLNRPRLLVPAYAKSLMVISPSMPLSCYGCVLTCCNKLGFDIFGSKRVRLNAKRASLLDIPGEFLANFTPSSTPPSPAVSFDSSSHPLMSDVSVKQVLAPLPSAIFIVGRENGRVHSYALQHLISCSLKSLGDSNPHIMLSSSSHESPSSLIHVTNYTEEKLKHFGAFSASISQTSNAPEGCGDKDINGDEFIEELCFVAIPGSRSLPLCSNLLDRVFHVKPLSELDFQGCLKNKPELEAGKDFEEPELVGMKTVPQLSRFHCKKLCPFPTSDHHYSQAVQLLTDKPASLLVFRGVSCCKRIQSYVKSLRGSSHIANLEEQLSYVVSRTASEGTLLSSYFFLGKELFSDPKNWSMAAYYPHAWVHEPDILQGFLTPRENLFSVVQLPMGQMTLALKVLDKLSRSGFQFAGVSAVELVTEKKGIAVR